MLFSAFIFSNTPDLYYGIRSDLMSYDLVLIPVAIERI
jgi:hypothetical protein